MQTVLSTAQYSQHQGSLLSVFWNSTGVPNRDQGFRPGNKQWNGQSRCTHYTFCCTGNASISFPIQIHHNTRKWWSFLFVPGLHPAGDVGVIRVPGSLRVLLLLPPCCHRLLCTANRDNWPWPAGVQPPGVGPGDGGSGLLPKPRGHPSVQPRLPGLRTHQLEYNPREVTAVGKRGKERQRKARPAFCVHLRSHPMTFRFRHHSGFREPGSTNIIYYHYIVFNHHCCHNFATE